MIKSELSYNSRIDMTLETQRRVVHVDTHDACMHSLLEIGSEARTQHHSKFDGAAVDPSSAIED